MADKETSMQNLKPFGVTNIKSHISIILDLDELNYTRWREVFETHCDCFEVSGHLDGTSVPKGPDDKTWKTLDSLVKMWIYSTIKPDVLNMVMNKGDSAQTVWKNIENLFQDNKDARANELESELRSIEIGDKKISDYCQRIKVISDLLSNIDEPVSDKVLVRCMVNGLSDKYEHVAGIIRHQKPMPTFLEARSMLIVEERRLNRLRPNLQVKDTSSSPTVLIAGNNTNSARNNGPQACRNFQRGFCQFGERCRFTHNNNNRRNNGNQNPQQFTWNTNSQPTPQVQRFGPQLFLPGPIPTQLMGGYFSPTGQPLFYGAIRSTLEQSRVQQNRSPTPQAESVLGPVPSVHQTGRMFNSAPQALQTGPTVNTATSQNANTEATTLPQAFNTMSLQDLSESGWYMDTGATSHLTSDAGLSDPQNTPPM